MKQISIAVLISLAALVAVAQPQAETVAVINGEVITAERLDVLYDNLSPQMRNQYDAGGGKKAFLENYIAKRLLLQEAAKRNFDKKPEVRQALDAARESALFDRYVRDVVASEVVPDSAVREFYEKNIDDFVVGDRIKARHIVIGTNKHSQAEAEEIARIALAEVQDSGATGAALRARFSEAARKYSEDASAATGGDLGWIDRNRLDQTFADAAFALEPGALSGVVNTQFGSHVILVDAIKPAGVQPFDEVRNDIREYLLSQRQAEIVAAVSRRTDALRRSGEVTVYSENID